MRRFVWMIGLPGCVLIDTTPPDDTAADPVGACDDLPGPAGEIGTWVGQVPAAWQWIGRPDEARPDGWIASGSVIAETVLDVESDGAVRDFVGTLTFPDVAFAAIGRLEGSAGVIRIEGACASSEPVVGCGTVQLVDATTLGIEVYAENPSGGPCWVWAQGDVTASR